MRLIVTHSMLVAAFAAVALLACDGNGDNRRGGADERTPAASPVAPLGVAEWAQSVCIISGVAAGALDVPGTGDPETLTLEERKQRAADVLAPRAEALAQAAASIAELEAPEEAAEFHEVLHTTMADVAAAWQELVDTAGPAQSGEEIDAANDVFIQAQNEADARVVAAYDRLDGDTAAALSGPPDCGILNEIRS